MIKEITINNTNMDKCTCGDTAAEHIDGMEQCFVIGCGCKEFTNEVLENEMLKVEDSKNDFLHG